MAVRARARSTRSLVMLLVLASLVTITVDYRQGRSGPLASLGRGALTVIAPMQEAVSKVIRPIGDFFGTLAELGSIRAERDRLLDELSELRAREITDTALAQDLAELQALFDLREGLNLPMTGARVIASGVSNFEWTVTIDKGSNDGLRIDLPVVTGAGLVGHVIEVTSGTAVVQLILDQGSTVAGRVLGSEVIGAITGNGENDLEMRFVDPDDEISPASQVVTAGYEGGLYPPAIPIGEVSRVRADEGALEQFVRVQPYVDFSSLDFVGVVLLPDRG
jgi:rod shape-determining protein MreC